MTSQPPVAVVIPTCNRMEFLPEAIRSVVEQDYSGPIECIVVDDGSDTPVGPQLREQFPQVRFLRKERAGSSAAREHGSRHSTAPLLAYLDDDDLFLPNKIRTQVELMQRCPQVDVCIHDFLKFNAGGDFLHTNFIDHNELWSCPHTPLGGDPPAHIWQPRAYTPALLAGGPFPPQTLMIRRAFWEHIGGWDVTIPGSGQDIEFGVRASWKGRVAFIDAPLTRVRRQHGSNISANVTQTYTRVVRELARLTPGYEPELRAFMMEALGGYYARVGWMLMHDGDARAAARHYRQAIRHGQRTPRVLARYMQAAARSIIPRGKRAA